MDSVKVSLPKPDDITGTKIKSFLKQLELSIHHLQKSVEQMESEGELSESTFIIYRIPYLDAMRDRLNPHENTISIHKDTLCDECQDIVIEIATT